MAKYSASGMTPAGTTLPILLITSSTTVSHRGFIYDLLVSSDSAPADVATRFQLQRGTATTGGSSFTPTALDPGDPAAIFGSKVGTFSSTTATSNSQMLEFALNQRATFRWVAAPGSEIILTAVASNFTGLYSVSSTATPDVNCTILWNE